MSLVGARVPNLTKVTVIVPCCGPTVEHAEETTRLTWTLERLFPPLALRLGSVADTLWPKFATLAPDVGEQVTARR